MPDNPQTFDENRYDSLDIERHHEAQEQKRLAREQSSRRRKNRQSRFRMRLVDDILNRLWGRQYGR